MGLNEDAGKKGKRGTYLRQVGTGLCYAWTESKEKRGDMEPWTGPLPWEGGSVAPTLPEGHGEVMQVPDENWRANKIREVVRQIEPKNYAKAAFGYPAMPKAQAVSLIAGFDVTRDEIAEAMLESEESQQEVEQVETEAEMTAEEVPAETEAQE